MLIDNFQIIKKNFINCVIQVGKKLLTHRKKYLGHGYWRNGQFKNKADLVFHNFYDSKLKKILNIDVVSEENSSNIKKKNLYWLVDPIDGTASYANGFDGYVTQAALIKDQKPILSCIFAPSMNLLFVGIKNKGAYINNKLIIPKKKKILKLIDNFNVPTGISKYVYNKLNLRHYVECGSIGLKCCYVASGKADIFIKDIAVRNYDIAPAQLILSESGCLIKNFFGHEITIGNNAKIKGLLVCQSNLLLKKILNVIKYKKIKKYLKIYEK